MKILITGGAGFIGSAVIREAISNSEHVLINVDKLTYAGNLESLSAIDTSERYFFEQVDICDRVLLREILAKHQPDIIMHLAAESHVDKSIDGPDKFIQTNIVGTFSLLEEARRYWLNMHESQRDLFRFHHVSTDEVYGDLGITKERFTEESSYKPSSPYSASKAASDHLVRAWGRTYGLPTLITNCSNNYGPYQFPEKLIPVVILNALAGKPIPIYGEGGQVRDWLFVEDHAKALLRVALEADVGGTYNIGGSNEFSNLALVQLICEILDELVDCHPIGVTKFEELIVFVQDRPGHDVRYAIDPSKIKVELDWSPEESLESGLRKTVAWYVANRDWSRRVDGRAVRNKDFHIGVKK